MINLDTRLLTLLNGFELSVFIHLVKRVNSENKCFPSRELLQKETGFGREKLAETIKSLIAKNILSTYQEKQQDGKFSKTIYVIETDLASIFVNTLGKELKDNRKTETRKTENRNRDTENRDTETPLTEKSTLSINHNLSINHSKGDARLNFSKNFYSLEIEKNKNNLKIKEYSIFVDILYGKNELEEELTALLRLEKQVSYKQFCKLLELSHENKKKFSNILPQITNDKKYTKNRINLYLILRTWITSKY